MDRFFAHSSVDEEKGTARIVPHFQRDEILEGDSKDKKPIDLQAIRQAEARLKKLLEEHPELRDPERQDALAEWLATLEEEDSRHGKEG